MVGCFLVEIIINHPSSILPLDQCSCTWMCCIRMATRLPCYAMLIHCGAAALFFFFRANWKTHSHGRIMTGWWFGTWILWLSHHIENNHPNWVIFFRGVGIPPTRWVKFLFNDNQWDVPSKWGLGLTLRCMSIYLQHSKTYTGEYPLSIRLMKYPIAQYCPLLSMDGPLLTRHTSLC